MNNARRKTIAKLVGEFEDYQEAVQSVLDEEEEYLEAMPEGLRGSERGEISETAVSSLQEAVGSLEELITALQDAIA